MSQQLTSSKGGGRGSILAKVDNSWQWGGGVSKLPEIGWRHLWTLPYSQMFIATWTLPRDFAPLSSITVLISYIALLPSPILLNTVVTYFYCSCKMTAQIFLLYTCFISVNTSGKWQCLSSSQHLKSWLVTIKIWRSAHSFNPWQIMSTRKLWSVCKLQINRLYLPAKCGVSVYKLQQSLFIRK